MWIPAGFRFGGVACGIKPTRVKLDLCLLVSDQPAVVAGVYTTNLVHAAPVALDRERTPMTDGRVVVINSGNANACTGERGYEDAVRMTDLAAHAVGAQGSQALVLSTGVIGHFLPMETVQKGIAAAGEVLAADEASLHNCARAMMTTDTVEKISSRSLTVDGKVIKILGLAKGAAMIGPNMATMLGVVLTDAALDANDAQEMLRTIADETFNCISVEGHMSTNDTVLLMANGAAGGEPLKGAALDQFRAALYDVCEDLARAIPADGEGASHLITIEVEGAASTAAARTIAKTVADSALVKCAISGADPNWGRIVSAAGYAGVPFDPGKVDLHVNDVLLYERGAPVPFDAAAVSASIRQHRETQVALKFGEGYARCRFWTTDLTAEYVHLNADYTT